MIIRFHEHSFEFELKSGASFAGHFRLSEDEKTLLAKLETAEPEDWYLDSNGERLPPNELFSLTPWSAETSSGQVTRVRQLTA